MSRNTSGTYSLPAGNPVVSGTTITSTAQNNTLADIAAELTNSLDRGGRGAMTAPLPLANGTNTAPALTFSAEPGSGLYRAGASDVRMQVGGVQTQGWGATGSTFPQGLVATQTAANATSVSGTGNGTGPGMTGLGGSASGPGGTFTGGGPSGYGVSGQGVGAASGVVGIGGPTSGRGGDFTGGGPNGAGILAIGTGSGAAINVGNGNIFFSAATPTSSTTIPANTLTNKSFAKCWGLISTSGAGAVSVSAGLSIASVALNGTTLLEITMTTPMSGTAYAVFGTCGRAGCYVSEYTLVSRTTTVFRVNVYSSAGIIDLSATALTLQVMALGDQ